MFTWSKHFETKLDMVDDQHKILFTILDKLIACFSSGVPSEGMVDQVLKELVEYSTHHFTYEEEMMLADHIDERHLTLHRMEHHSFCYDLEHLQLHTNVDEDEVQVAERIVSFISSWLAYHILGVDMVMTAQIKAIRGGMSPQQAYETHNKIQQDAAQNRIMLNAVLDLWRGATERCRALETKLASLG